MLVRMLTYQAGATFVREPGDVLEIEDGEALRLCDKGYAVPERAALRETAVATPLVEQAIVRRRIATLRPKEEPES